MESIKWSIERLLLLPPEELGKGIDELCNQISKSELKEEVREEVYQLFELLKTLEGYKQFGIPPKDWAWAIFMPFMQPRENVDAKSLCLLLSKQIENFVEKEPSDQFISNIRQIGVLSIAKYFFNIFLQVNWTGPQFSNPRKISMGLNDNNSHDASTTFNSDILLEVLGDANLELVKEDCELIKTFISDLNIDGEVLYEMTRGIGYLWASLSILQIIIYKNNILQGNDKLKTLFIWYSRVTYIWQRVIRKAYENISPTLFDISILRFEESLKNLELLPNSFSFKKTQQSNFKLKPNSPQDSKKMNNDILKSLETFINPQVMYTYSLPEIEQFGPYERSSLLLEFAIRLSFFGYTDSFSTISDRACEMINFRFELSGAYGIRRKYQTKSFAQLVVKTFSEFSPTYEKENLKKKESLNGDQKSEGHKYWSLSEVNPETDILESPQFSETQEDGGEVAKSLSAFEQCLLLARCSYLQASTPASADMAFEELAAIVQRCLVLPKSASTIDPCNHFSEPYLSSHWLVFSSGLWFRCKAENHRLKTIERASLQLQSLVDQYYDEEPSGLHRLNYIHILDYPNQWEAKRELGIRMLSIGSFISAYNMFKDMMMWEEAVNCLVAANKKVEAKNLVEERLAIQPSPPLWCVKGQLDDDHTCYIKAWELSKNRYAGAQRLLGSYYFRQQNFEASVVAFDLALQINPLHTNSWFTLGCSLMRLELWERALLSFSKVVSLEPEQGEAWANMAGIHIQKQQLREAVQCIEQSLRYNREDWRIWDTYLKVNVQLRDIPKVIEAMSKMILDFKMKQKVPNWCFGFLHQQAISDKMEGLHENFKKIANFFEFVYKEIPNQPQISFQYATILKIDGQFQKSFNIIVSHLRQVQARLFNSNSNNLENEKVELEKSLTQISSLIPDLGNLKDNETKIMSHDLKLTLKAIENRMDKFPSTYHENSINLINKILVDVGS